MEDYLNFVGELPESPYRRELDVLYARAQKALGKYTGSEDLLKVDDRTREKELKSTEKASGK